MNSYQENVTIRAHVKKDISYCGNFFVFGTTYGLNREESGGCDYFFIGHKERRSC